MSKQGQAEAETIKKIQAYYAAIATAISRVNSTMPVDVAVNKVITSALLAHVADYINRAPTDDVSERLENANRELTDLVRAVRRDSTESGN